MASRSLPCFSRTGLLPGTDVVLAPVASAVDHDWLGKVQRWVVQPAPECHVRDVAEPRSELRGNNVSGVGLMAHRLTSGLKGEATVVQSYPVRPAQILSKSGPLRARPVTAVHAVKA